MQHIAQPQPVLDRLPARRPKAACTLGIIGGGQLAKMIAQSALQLGCDIVVLERKEHSPAANLATETVIGDWDNPESLLTLGSMVDVVTLEAYAKAGADAYGVGSSLFRAERMAAQDWEWLRNQCRAFAGVYRKTKQSLI